jgi:diacylglycerol O-acyltransferase / wax synthase
MSRDLPPGIRRLRPDDHFMILMDTDATPIQIGALLLFDTDGQQTEFGVRMRAHLSERLAGTPLLAVLHQCPDGYDSDVWADVASCDLDYHVTVVGESMSTTELYEFVAREAMVRLDLTRPPFRAFLIRDVGEGRSAVYLKVHHAVTDGVGFQSLLSRFSDDVPRASTRRAMAALPDPVDWLSIAEARFVEQAPRRAAHRARMDSALAVLKSGELPRRARTPVLKMSGPTSALRSFDALSVSLDRIRTVAHAFSGTVNDIFLALAASALRRYLIDIDDLPADPIVVNSARSYRRPEHGLFGNRIVALHPNLATHIADPVERLRVIQASMANERLRTGYDEAMLDAPEKPFGPRDRRAKFVAKTSGDAVLPGNITLSNVPGPSGEVSFAGYRLVANYPSPLLGSGRFLNVTSRRLGNALDMGIMVDPTRITDVTRFTRYLGEALDEYEALANLAWQRDGSSS